jgi:hypothetical protein
MTHGIINYVPHNAANCGKARVVPALDQALIHKPLQLAL